MACLVWRTQLPRLRISRTESFLEVVNGTTGLKEIKSDPRQGLAEPTQMYRAAFVWFEHPAQGGARKTAAFRPLIWRKLVCLSLKVFL